MSLIGEQLLRSVLRLRGLPYKRPANLPNHDYDSYIRWQYESSSRLFGLYPDFDLRGKTVLDLGCGTGGRAAWLAQAGAERVVGIDLNAPEIEIAREAVARMYPESAKRVTYLPCTENDLLEIGPFDVVLLVDAMEHVVSPPAILKLAHHYTRPGGKVYFSSYGFYHRAGAHLDLMPFVNVFFSDETILNTVRWLVSRSDYVPHLYDSDPPIERWRGIYDLRDRPGEHLNRLTVHDMKMIARYNIFARARLTVVGFGRRRAFMKLFDWLRHVPIVQEVYHSYVVVELQRQDDRDPVPASPPAATPGRKAAAVEDHREVR